MGVVGAEVELCQFMVLPEFFWKMESRPGTCPEIGWVWRVAARGHADGFSKAPLLIQRLAGRYDDARKWSFAQGGRGLGVRGSCLMRTRGVPVRVYH